MNTPLISVIIPCYNQGQYLTESIGSVLASDYKELEIIVVDDGSTDPETCRILGGLGYPKTRLIRRENGGLAAARNSGIAAAQGRYILPLDADDRIGPHYISQAVAAFEVDPSLAIVYCKAEKFGAESGAWPLPAFSRFRMALGNVIFCSALYRKSDWEMVGGYDPSLSRGWEDWDFWLSLLEAGRNVIRLPQVGFYYRKHHSSMAASMGADLKTELHRRIILKHSRYFGFLAVLLAPILRLYYQMAATRLYRTIKLKGRALR